MILTCDKNVLSILKIGMCYSRNYYYKNSKISVLNADQFIQMLGNAK